MNTIYAREVLPPTLPHSIFLMGPTPRDSSDTASWRPAAVQALLEAGFEGTVIIPEEHPDADGTVHFRGDYDHQVAWEREALQKASVVLAWIPRNIVTLPAFTTNVEWGMLWDSGKIVLGAPPEAPGNRYLRWYAELGHVPTANSLPETVGLACEMLSKFEAEEASCVFCRIIHRDPEQQIEAQLEHSVLFTPHHPVTPGHKLVVPRLHVSSAADNPGVAAMVFGDAEAYVRRTGIQANIITSIGADASQTIFHLHVHVVPRSAGDGLTLPWTGQKK